MSWQSKSGVTEKLVYQLATLIYPYFAPKSSPPRKNPIKVVCISDTHNTQPLLPYGDIILHGGDLVSCLLNFLPYGGVETFLQNYERHIPRNASNLSWLSSQPHEHKIVIAGNQDSILDPKFMAKRYARDKWLKSTPGEELEDLKWGSLIYLKDSSVTLEFAEKDRKRLKIYGAPHTPAFENFAFQHACEDDVWSDTVPEDTNILLTHGPPLGFPDDTGSGERVGSKYLLHELRRKKPEGVVFGHIHEGFGQEVVRFDRADKAMAGIISGKRENWLALIELVVWLFWRRMVELISVQEEGVTRLCNVAVIEGHSDVTTRDATVLLLWLELWHWFGVVEGRGVWAGLV